METIVMLTFASLPEHFTLPSGLLALAERADFSVHDPKRTTDRYIRLKSRRPGSYLEGHISDVMEHIASIVHAVRAEAPDVSIELGCVIYGDSQNGVYFSSERLRQIVALDMALGLEAYNVGGDKEPE